MIKKKSTTSKVSLFLSIIGIIGAIASIIGFIFASLYGIGNQDLRPERNLSSIINDIESRKKKIEIINKNLKNLENILNSYSKAPKNLEYAKLITRIEAIENSVNAIKASLGSDIERTLSVPLLRKDIEALQKSLEDRTLYTAREIERIYDQNKWFIGLMVTMAIGLLGLAVSNIIQTRKKDEEKGE